jgi:hypothetical protein
MSTLKLILFNAFFLTLLVSANCRKQPNVGANENYKKPSFKIEIGSDANYRYYPTPGTANGNDTYKDTQLLDSKFFIYRANSSFNWPMARYFFKMVSDSVNQAFIKNLSWKIGTEQQWRNGAIVNVDFSYPVNIPIKLAIEYDYPCGFNQLCRIRDTINKQFELIGVDSVKMKFRGAYFSSPSDSFDILFDYTTEPLIPYYSQTATCKVINFPKTFPYKIDLSEGVGVYGIIPKYFSFSTNSSSYPQPITYKGKYLLECFGTFFLYENDRRVHIKLSGMESTVPYWDVNAKTYNDNFTGVRIQ